MYSLLTYIKKTCRYFTHEYLTNNKRSNCFSNKKGSFLSLSY